MYLESKVSLPNHDFPIDELIPSEKIKALDIWDNLHIYKW